MNETERKLNYLLAKVNKPPPEEETELLKWLRESRYELTQLISIKNALFNEGLTLDDAIDQIQFGREFKALQAFEVDYKAMQNSSIVSVSPGTFVFERKMLKEFSNRIGRLPNPDENRGLYDYKTGMLLLTLPTNRILNSNTANYFNSSSETGSLSVIQNEIGPLVNLTIYNTTYTLQGEDSKILNMRQLNKVIQQVMIVLLYRIVDDNVVITSMEGVLDLNAISITLGHSIASMTVPFQRFLEFCFDLPPSVQLLLNVFANDFTDQYLAIKELYTSSLIRELIPQMVTHYNTVYGESTGSELYGQSAAVAISQLYTFSETVVRRETVEYRLTNGSLPLDNPRYLSPIQDTSKFIADIPRQRFHIYGLLPDNNNTNVNAWTLDDVPIRYQGANISLSSAVIGTELYEQRPTTRKAEVIKSTRTRDSIAHAWIEETITNYSNITLATTGRFVKVLETGETLPTSEYMFDPVAGGNRQSSIGDGNSAQAILYGLSLRVKNQNTEWKTFEYKIRKTYTATAMVETKVVLYPDDLSSESTNPLSVRVTWRRNGTSRTTRISMNPQRIMFGESEVNAYVGTIQIESRNITFTIDSTVTFDSERGTWSYGNMYRGNDLNELIRTGDAHSFNAKQSNGEDAIAVVIATNNQPQGRVYSYIPGTVMDNSLFRVPNRIIVSPPLDWPNYGNNILTTDIISCYLSLTPKIESTIPSPLYVENDTIDLMVTGEVSASVDVFGYTDINTIVNLREMKRNTVVALDYFLIKGFEHATLPSTDELSLTELTGEVAEILLPSGADNQFTLSESLISTRHSINLLIQYADYLDYLITTLDKRLQHVEKTMTEIIQAIDSIITSLTPKTASFGSQLLMFLGTSVGMFFPLTGLAINIIGQLYSGFESITDGNLTTGTMDIAMGCLMSILGVRKFKQRMDRKYGANVDITPPSPPGRLPSYDELFGPPGFTTVGTRVTPPSYDSLRLASGTVKNSNITYSQNKVIIDTMLLQQGLYNSYLPSTLTQNSTMDASCVVGKVVETWNDSGIFESITYQLLVQQMDGDNNIIDRVIDNVTFQQVHNTNLPVDLFVKYLFVYGNLGEQISQGFGLDPEVMSILALSNFSIPLPQSSELTLYTNNHPRVKHIDKLLLTNVQSQNVYQSTNSILSISDFSEIMNPYVMNKALTSQLFTNVYSFITGSDN